jgi:pyruvate formate lyase activating enzyme
MIKDAILWKSLEDGKVECFACSRRCKIPEGSHGFCFVRQNIGGRLKLADYGVIAAMQVDPIEKKPFNHFMPGTYVFGIGTSSCNWGCLFCQNHNISKQREINGAEKEPQDIVDMALLYNTKSIAFTYNEPTIFIEYALDVAKKAHKNGINTLFVSNGYMTGEAVAKMKGNIDAVVVDYKGSGEQKFANRYEAVVSNDAIKDSMLAIKKAGMHLELTDLIIPRVGESLKACDELTRWVAQNLGDDTPIHFTQFHPDYKMLDYPMTEYSALLDHYKTAKKNGLNYVYVGNVIGNPYESTYCSNCGNVVIGRSGFYITAWNLTNGSKCAECGNMIPIVGGKPKKFEFRDITALY